MTTHISNTEECRRLARNVVTPDFTDSQIISYQEKEYSLIATLTDKDDWDSSDREYGALQNIETMLTACDIKAHYGETEEQIRLIGIARAAALAELDIIVKNMDTEIAETEIEFQINKTEPKGWGLNSGVLPPDRLTNNSSSSDIEGF